MPITPLPTAPSRSQPPSTFAENADAFLGQLPTFAAEATTLEQTVNAAEASAIAANTSAIAAESSAVSAKNAAQAAQAAAEAVANATEWTGGTVTAGECRYGSDGQTYRCLVTHTDVDPVTDETGVWVRISASGGVYEDISPGGTLVSGGYRLSSTGSYTLVATPKKSTQIDFMLDCEPSEADKITIVRGGETIGGRAEDMTVENPWIKKWTMVFNGTTWVVLI